MDKNESKVIKRRKNIDSMAVLQRQRLRSVIDPTLFLFSVGLTDYPHNFVSLFKNESRKRAYD
jgi:hypothetical protein